MRIFPSPMPGRMVSTPWARSFKVATIFSWLSHSWGRRLGSKEMGSSKALARLISRLVAARALGETAGKMPVTWSRSQPERFRPSMSWVEI